MRCPDRRTGPDRREAERPGRGHRRADAPGQVGWRVARAGKAAGQRRDQEQDGGPERGAELSRGVDDAGGATAPAFGDVRAQAGGGDRRQPDAQPGDRGAHRHRPRGAGRRDEGCVGGRDGQQARRHHALREKTPLQPGGQSRAHDDEQAERHQGGRRFQGRTVQRVLQVQRDQRDHRAGGRGVEETAQCPLAEVALADKRVRQQGRGRPAVGSHEGTHQRHGGAEQEATGRPPGRGRDQGGADDECHHRRGEQG
jgi:hypothetical protein